MSALLWSDYNCQGECTKKQSVKDFNERRCNVTLSIQESWLLIHTSKFRWFSWKWMDFVPCMSIPVHEKSIYRSTFREQSCWYIFARSVHAASQLLIGQPISFDISLFNLNVIFLCTDKKNVLSPELMETTQSNHESPFSNIIYVRVILVCFSWHWSLREKYQALVLC